MREKLKYFWKQGGYLLLGLVFSILVLGLVSWDAKEAKSADRQTVAQPPAQSEVTFDMETNRAYTAEDGVIVIRPAEKEETAAEYFQNPEQIWEGSQSLSTEGYTLPEETVMADGSIGFLSIPKLNLYAPVYEAEEGSEMEAMRKGIAHFAVTSAWNGNIGLCSHNEAPAGAVAYFRDIHLLEQGDTLVYATSLGERQYRVTQVLEIPEDDWSYLSRSEENENKITMITCITGKPEKRLMVQAKEK